MSLLRRALTQSRPRRISHFMANLCNKATASFEDVKTVCNSQTKTLLVDVREPSELKETGVIPGSINIPLGELENALKNMSPESFQRTYGRPKPQHSSAIIFSCKAGKRGAQAQEIATKLGFSNTRNYAGGWLDWEEKMKK